MCKGQLIIFGNRHSRRSVYNNITLCIPSDETMVRPNPTNAARAVPPGVRMMYNVGDDLVEYFMFDNMGDWELWQAELGIIKNLIAELNRRITEGGINGNAALRAILQPWIARVQNFATLWGNHRVPLDVKHALRTTEGALNIVPTVWGDARVDVVNDNAGHGAGAPDGGPDPAQE